MTRWLVGSGVFVAILAASYMLGRSHEADRWKLREASAKAAAQHAIALEQARQRDIEQRHAAASQLAAQELQNARQQIAQRDRALDSLRLDAGRLRDQLSAYAAGGAGEDTAAACRDRAAALAAYAADLGAAAAAVGRTARQAASERDEFAAEVVACVRAWPRP